MDKISQLPEPIQHHILSFLETKEAAKTSVLSKTWRAIAQSLPILDFKQSHFIPKNKNLRNLEHDELMTMESNFNNHVEDRVHRLTALESTIQNVSIELEIYHQGRSGPKLDAWIQKLATDQSRIREFSLVIHCYAPSSSAPVECYRLPPAVLCSKTITNLKLSCRCHLKDCRSNVSLPNLLELRLERVALSQEHIDSFISGCPSLEILELRYCTGLSSICVSGLARLNTLVLESCINLSQARVVAPMLRIFKISINPRITGQTNIVDLSGCESTLRILRLSGTNTTKEQLKSCISKFLQLDELSLHRLDLESIEISNQNIRKLNISTCRELETVDISAPDRLQVLNFVSNKLPFYPVSSKSSLNKTIDFYGSFYKSTTLCDQPLFSNLSNSIENFFLEFNQCKDIEVAIYHSQGLFTCKEPNKERFIDKLHQLKNSFFSVKIMRRNFSVHA